MARLTRRNFFKAGALGAAGLTAAAALADGTGYALQGIDVSRWQEDVDWAAVRASGRRFAFAKATDGATAVDPYFAANWAGIRRVGLFRGAYHFARPGADPITQANHFVNTVKPSTGDLKMVLDLETADGLTPTQVRAWTVAFVNRMVERTGQTPIIYTGYFFWRDSAGNGSNLGCPLWLAQYRAVPNLIPAAWTTWTFWQYTDTGSCSGVVGNCDLNAFNGSNTDLNNLRQK